MSFKRSGLGSSRFPCAAQGPGCGGCGRVPAGAVAPRGWGHSARHWHRPRAAWILSCDSISAAGATSAAPRLQPCPLPLQGHLPALQPQRPPLSLVPLSSHRQRARPRSDTHRDTQNPCACVRHSGAGTHTGTHMQTPTHQHTETCPHTHWTVVGGVTVAGLIQSPRWSRTGGHRGVTGPRSWLVTRPCWLHPGVSGNPALAGGPGCPCSACLQRPRQDHAELWQRRAPREGLGHVAQVAVFSAKGQRARGPGRSERPGPGRTASARPLDAHTSPTRSHVSHLFIFISAPTFCFDKCRFHKNRTSNTP